MGGNIRKKATVKAPGKSARKTAKKTRSVKAVTPKAFRTDAPMRPDRLTTGPRRDLKLPVTAPTDAPVRPVDVTRDGWSEKHPPKTGKKS